MPAAELDSGCVSFKHEIQITPMFRGATDTSSSKMKQTHTHHEPVQNQQAYVYTIVFAGPTDKDKQPTLEAASIGTLRK
jgi:hypothetical protein